MIFLNCKLVVLFLIYFHSDQLRPLARRVRVTFHDRMHVGVSRDLNHCSHERCIAFELLHQDDIESFKEDVGSQLHNGFERLYMLALFQGWLAQFNFFNFKNSLTKPLFLS